MNDAVIIQRDRTDAELPAYGYPGDAGMDLAVVGEHILSPGASMDLPTGLRIELPEGVWARITGRSSTLRQRGLFVNEGVIDQGYRGELFIYVTNRNARPATIESGTRLAQLILAPVVRYPVVEGAVGESVRGAKGFGSTGWGSVLEHALHELRPVSTPLVANLATSLLPDMAVPVAEEARGHTDTAETAEAKEDTTERLGRAVSAVYLGGPIDYTLGSPEDRHRRLIVACQMAGVFWDVYCPACRKRADETAAETVLRNQSELRARDVAIFEYDADTQRSIGTPIEIWSRAQLAQPQVVVGSLGDGLFARVLRDWGVVEVSTMRAAVEWVKAWLM